MKPKRWPTKQRSADAFELVRTAGLTLPGVEATTKYDGSAVLKVRSSDLENTALLFRRLRSDEFDLAHGILLSAAERLISKGIRQWTTAYPREQYLVCQENGWNYALVSKGDVAVIVTLSWEIPVEWADYFGTTPVWWLSKLATAPGYHGFGLGARAVQHAISAVSSHSADRLYLDCVHGKGFLVDFYRRLGFQTIDRRNVRFPTGLFDMVLMGIELRKTV